MNIHLTLTQISFKSRIVSFTYDALKTPSIVYYSQRSGGHKSNFMSNRIPIIAGSVGSSEKSICPLGNTAVPFINKRHDTSMNRK